MLRGLDIHVFVIAQMGQLRPERDVQGQGQFQGRPGLVVGQDGHGGGVQVTGDQSAASYALLTYGRSDILRSGSLRPFIRIEIRRSIPLAQGRGSVGQGVRNIAVVGTRGYFASVGLPGGAPGQENYRHQQQRSGYSPASLDHRIFLAHPARSCMIRLIVSSTVFRLVNTLSIDIFSPCGHYLFSRAGSRLGSQGPNLPGGARRRQLNSKH